MDEVVLKIFVS